MENIKKSLYFLAPLLIGAILIIGAGSKIINGLNSKGYANILYFEVFSGTDSSSAIAHDLKISFPNSIVTELFSSGEIKDTCTYSSKSEICLKVSPLDFNTTDNIPLIWGTIQSNEMNPFVNSIKESTFTDNQGVYDENLLIEPKFSKDQFFVNMNEFKGVVNSIPRFKEDAPIDRIGYLNIVLFIIGVIFVLSSLLIRQKISSKEVLEKTTKSKGKLLLEAILLAFIGVISIIAGLFLGQKTQTPIEVDALSQLNNPVKYLQVLIKYNWRTNSIVSSEVSPGFGFIPQIQSNPDSPLKIKVEDFTGNSLYELGVTIPEILINPIIDPETNLPTDPNWANSIPSEYDVLDIIVNVPQLLAEKTLAVYLNDSLIQDFDISEYYPDGDVDNETIIDIYGMDQASKNDGYLDIAIIGNGYTSNSMNSFKTLAESIKKAVLEFEPYNFRRSQVRFSIVENTQSLSCRTADASTFIMCDYGLVTNILNQKKIKYDKIAVIHNENKRCGTSTGVGTEYFFLCVGSTPDSVFVHELSHGLGLLDEYTNRTNSAPLRITGLNCHDSNQNPAWKDIVGKYSYSQGCDLRTNLWRTSFDSVMRFDEDSRYYNAVSLKIILDEIDAFTGEFTTDDPAPDAKILSPKNHEKVNGKIDMEIAYENAEHLQRVELWIDNEIMFTEYEDFENISKALQNITIPNKEVQLTIKAYDSIDRTGKSATIKLNPDGIGDDDPTDSPEEPTDDPEPTDEPEEPTEEPEEPTDEPEEPTDTPEEPTDEPEEPTEKPTKKPTKTPTPKPTKKVIKSPTPSPTSTNKLQLKCGVTGCNKDSDCLGSPDYKCVTNAMNPENPVKICKKVCKPNEVQINICVCQESKKVVNCGPMDINNDGILNYIDLASFAIVYGDRCKDSSVNFGPCGGKDSNKDGQIDYMDLGHFANKYSPRSKDCYN